MSELSNITPSHIQQAKAALREAGIPVAIGNQALDLATAFYQKTPQVSRTDTMRRERNLIQDELETVSSQLQQERQKTRRLEQELEAALKVPKFHQKKAHKLRKQLRAILAVLQHPQAKETTKLKGIARLVATALTETKKDMENSANSLGTDEYYRLNYSDSSKKKAYFGFECEVYEDDFTLPRTQFVHPVDNGSTEYEQLRAAGYECLYDDGTGESPRLLQNFIESGEEFKALCRITDPALAKEEGW
jgi:hypothetical protein